MTSAEFLTFPPSAKYRAGKAPDLPGLLFGELLRTARAAGVEAVRTPRYVGRSDWLVLYGPGGPDRVAPMRAQAEAGRRVLCWDAPYWQRGAKLRVSVDHAHPQAWVMRRDWPAHRLADDGVAPTDAWDPAGPVLVAGVGAKARAQYGQDRVRAWEAAQVAECRRRWPSRVVHYRPKPNHGMPPVPGAVEVRSTVPIDAALRGCGLVVTWHSNVAVDAIRLGVPVVCADGAAAAVCPMRLPAGPVPAPLDPAVRDRFLANLAWFQWAPHEAAACWAFLRRLLTPPTTEEMYAVH